MTILLLMKRWLLWWFKFSSFFVTISLVVIWNPWAQKAMTMSDFGDDEVCLHMYQSYTLCSIGPRLMSTVFFFLNSIIVCLYAVCGGWICGQAFYSSTRKEVWGTTDLQMLLCISQSYLNWLRKKFIHNLMQTMMSGGNKIMFFLHARLLTMLFGILSTM